METTHHDLPCTRISKGDNMKRLRTIRIVVGSALLWSVGLVMAGIGRAQQIPEQFYSEMKWGMIGAFRAGKVNGVAGVAGNPGGYYFGADGGGVGEEDGGR